MVAIRTMLILASLCIQLATIAHAIEDFITINNIVQEISKLYKKYNNKALDLSPSFIKKLTQPLPFPEPKHPKLKYDFIIVGCGSAGSVLANRLSENPRWKILVLEAGKPENLLSRIPLAVSVLPATELDWKYDMEVDPAFGRGIIKQRMSWPRGKALGGSSVINYMIYNRGDPLDYNSWADQGNPGWSYDDVLPYFLKSEYANLRYENPKYHNSNGHLSVEHAYESELVHTFIKAGGELGYKKYIDYNSEDNIGFSTVQATLLKGRRHSAARAFLYPVRYRRNLHVLTQAHVTKVLINSKTKRVFGVRYIRNKIEYEVYGKKEIILSSGVINTPQILMLSGIGPKKHLEELGIHVIEDLAVGNQLYDHIFYFGLNFVISKPLSLTPAKVLNPLAYKMFSEKGTGPWSSIGSVEGLGFIHTNQTVDDQADIELQMVSGSIASDCGLIQKWAFGIPDKIYDMYWAHLKKLPTFTIFPILQHPKSKGFLKLRSKHPLVPPLIYGNYLTDHDRHDVKTLIAGIRYAIRLIKTKAFAKYHTYLDPTPVPGCGIFLYNSDSYWECAIRTFSYTGFHPMGTVKMGPANDPHSVVDHELRVYGVKGLRVADMSIPPVTLTGHLNAQAIMIGEKASDLIKQSWRNHTSHQHYKYEEDKDDYDEEIEEEEKKEEKEGKA